jgi:striatin 1/3/4
MVFSASMDTTIRLWRLSSRDHDPYAPYDSSTAIQTLEGHTDVVWDICLLPGRPDKNAANGTRKSFSAESQLVSVSADGSAKVWEHRGGRWILASTFADFGAGVIPTCLSVDNHDFSRVLIGLSNGLVQAFSVDSGRVLQTFGKSDSQVNAIFSHTTLSLIVTGHEDGQLGFYNTKTGESTPPSRAHPAPITSLAPSPLSSMCMFSASVDCSLRLWDLERKMSLQDLSGHRQRFDEGVTHVASHPELPIIASAGADGVVRLWAWGSG